jgi:plastocyanin
MLKKLIIISTLISAFASNAFALEEYHLVIKNHKFQPEILELPAGKKIKIIVDNQDPTPEEFESHDLNREKIIRGNSKGSIFLNPLTAGEYKFFGEFNEATAKGKIIVK